MNPGIRQLVDILAEQVFRELYDGARAEEPTSGFSTGNEAGEQVLTGEAAAEDK